MNLEMVSPQQVRQALLFRREIALLDLRDEDSFAKGHPLFAAQLPLERIAVEAPTRLPRKEAAIVLYDDGEGYVEEAAGIFTALGYRAIRRLEGGLAGWREAGFELFQDVNSYCKAFGELVEHRRHTPSFSAEELDELIAGGADIAILDARRFEEYSTMSIPGGTSVPGAELVLRLEAAVPDPATTIIVNCAGRTRSIIGTQSLINAGVPNPVRALRNGTIGWTLAGKALQTGQRHRTPIPQRSERVRERARDVAYRAGVKHIDQAGLNALSTECDRTLYRFDVRQPEEYRDGHLDRFRNAPGGQLIQETDHFAPVRGARIVVADDLGVRADMSASWLAQMGWEVYVLDEQWPSMLECELGDEPPARNAKGRYKRPYEGTDNPAAAMQAYLTWEYGLVDQLARDATHGFFVI